MSSMVEYREAMAQMERLREKAKLLEEARLREIGELARKHGSLEWPDEAFAAMFAKLAKAGPDSAQLRELVQAGSELVGKRVHWKTRQKLQAGNAASGHGGAAGISPGGASGGRDGTKPGDGL